MGTNKKNPRAKEPQVTTDKIFTEFDLQAERNIAQNLQTQGKKVPTVIPKSKPFR